ncbi:hypothetical protein THAOC_21408, partial [Thalassiosira oceanica]
MQRLAGQALASSSSSDGVSDAAPRPCGGGPEPCPLNGAEVDAPPGLEGGDDGDGPTAPCGVVASSADDDGHETSQPAERDALSSWRAWADQPPWDRPVPSVVRASGLSRPDLRSGAYGTRLHPDRVRYLAAAAGDAPSYADL